MHYFLVGIFYLLLLVFLLRRYKKAYEAKAELAKTAQEGTKIFLKNVLGVLKGESPYDDALFRAAGRLVFQFTYDTWCSHERNTREVFNDVAAVHFSDVPFGVQKEFNHLSSRLVATGGCLASVDEETLERFTAFFTDCIRALEALAESKP